MSLFRKLNLEVFLQLIILLGLAGFFLLILLNGSVQLYVHPRIVPYLIFGVIAMLLIAAYVSKDLFKPFHRRFIGAYFFFIIPLVLAYAMPAKAMDSTSMAYNDPNMTGLTSSSSSTSTSQGAAVSATAQGQTSINALTIEDGIIMMNSGNFYTTLQDISENIDQFTGKQIQVVCFVFKDDQLEENEFVAARMLMICCTADLQPIGFLCRYDKATGLAHDSWITVTGTLDTADYQGEKLPCIDVTQVEPAEKPIDEYVYPF